MCVSAAYTGMTRCVFSSCELRLRCATQSMTSDMFDLLPCRQGSSRRRGRRTRREKSIPLARVESPVSDVSRSVSARRRFYAETETLSAEEGETPHCDRVRR